MRNWLLTKILTLIGKKLSGKKLYIGIAMKVLAGLMGILQTTFPDLAVAVPNNAIDSVDKIGDAFVGIGAAHKAQKLLSTNVSQSQVIQDQNIILAAQLTGNKSIKAQALDVAKTYTTKLKDNPSGISPDNTGDLK